MVLQYQSKAFLTLHFTCPPPSCFLMKSVRTGVLRHHSFSRDERASLEEEGGTICVSTGADIIK